METVVESNTMSTRRLRVIVSLLVIFAALWMKYGGIKYTVKNVDKYDYILLTDSIYPIRYQLVLIDNVIRKQFYFVENNVRISCKEFVNAEVDISTENNPIYGVFVNPECLRQYNLTANILIGSGKSEAAIRLLDGGQMNELHNPLLFVRAEKFVESFAFTLLKYIYNIFLPIGVIVFIFDAVNALRKYFHKK
jgi:hypothetical protein